MAVYMPPRSSIWKQICYRLFDFVAYDSGLTVDIRQLEGDSGVEFIASIHCGPRERDVLRSTHRDPLFALKNVILRYDSMAGGPRVSFPPFEQSMRRLHALWRRRHWIDQHVGPLPDWIASSSRMPENMNEWKILV